MELLTLSTAEDLMKLSTKGRYELIKGVIYEMSPSGERHGFIAWKIGYIIGKYVQENKLGIITAAETGYKLSSEPDTVRAPDVAFKSNRKVQEGGITDGYSTVMPEIVVEVSSPSDSHGKVIKKVDLWLSSGVRQVWVVDPEEKNVIIYDEMGKHTIFENNDIIQVGEILPGFECKVNEIF